MNTRLNPTLHKAVGAVITHPEGPAYLAWLALQIIEECARKAGPITYIPGGGWSVDDGPLRGTLDEAIAAAAAQPEQRTLDLTGSAP